ncbi:hypothetical protein OG800_07960 [Streptomyces sp. NBC_00445]|uniref:hypothetical protein n=1 Tax=Streptomyces sp. NBC_00445 TaxID=2975745 RepID=UPI002E1F6097
MSEIERLNDQDLEIIQQCLDAAVIGPFFEDRAFHTLIGATRETTAAIAASWPSLADPELEYVVSNVMVNLLWYPHGYGSRWHEYISGTSDQAFQVLDRWRGNSDGGWCPAEWCSDDRDEIAGHGPNSAIIDQVSLTVCQFMVLSMSCCR